MLELCGIVRQFCQKKYFKICPSLVVSWGLEEFERKKQEEKEKFGTELGIYSNR